MTGTAQPRKDDWLTARGSEAETEAALEAAADRATGAALSELGLSLEDAPGTAELIREKIIDLISNLQAATLEEEGSGPDF